VLPLRLRVGGVRVEDLVEVGDHLA